MTFRGLSVLAALTALAAIAGAADPKPEVETGAAGTLGREAFTANGRIQPRGLPTRYYFEYGPTADYGNRTAEAVLPGKLAAFYHETWDGGLAGWKGGMSGADLVHHPEGGASKGFVRFSEPSGDDPNHVDGIGTLHLSTYFYPGTFPGGGTAWGGGEPDLRDARVRLHVRGNGWVPNGSELVWWTQSDADLSKQTAPDWRRANWAYTGFSLTPFLASGKWERVEYRLTNDSEAWTYAGNNLAQKRPNYAYFSVDRSQASVNADFFHLLAFVDPANRPQGTFDVDEFEIAYRNHSLLFPGNGGKLAASSKSDDDPARLTDGWRYGPGHQWASAGKPAGPLEFTWDLANPVTVTGLQIHQHSDSPSREFEVLTSEDGRTWTPLHSGTLPESSPQGPNFANVLKRGLSARARHVRLKVLSGYKAERWGLGEVELFGTGAVEQTDDDWYHVNTDITGLKPGAMCHYRLVAVTSAGAIPGPDRTATLPSDDRPVCTTGRATRVTSTTARLDGRLCPMGQRTQFHFEYGPTPALGMKTASQYGGLQISPRSAHAEVAGLTPDAAWYFRLVATNATGEAAGEIVEFRTPK